VLNDEPITGGKSILRQDWFLEFDEINAPMVPSLDKIERRKAEVQTLWSPVEREKRNCYKQHRTWDMPEL
tara:strand:+ start:280 stop:489 length:210 start_codon:yes stop_codon:yes gene_type:complete